MTKGLTDRSSLFVLKSRKSFVNVSVDKEFLYGILMLGSILDIRKGYKYETEFQF